MNSLHSPNARSGEQAVNPAVFALGALALIVAAVASGMLCYEHISGYSLPGCGPGSPCARLAASEWGKIPGLDWPVAFAGLGYFSGMLGAWIATKGSAPCWMRWIATLGALASAAFIGIMLGMGHNSICPYCLTSHLANFSFLAVLGMTPRSGAPAMRPLRAPAAAIVTLAAVTAALALADSQVHHSVDQKFESDFAAESKRIVDAAKQRQHAAQPTAPAPKPEVKQAEPPPPPQISPGGSLFTGRYRFGPEKAAVRVVMYTDYQCPDCRVMEEQVKKLLETHPNDVSISTKYFPFCSECNDFVKDANFHPNACWAARAAEAAGMMYGVGGFKKIHFWLFEHKGSFTAAELDQGLAEFGWTADRERFLALMTGPETLARIQGDIREAVSFGLTTTPLIFINGTELTTWKATDALVRQVEALIAAKAPVEGPENDRPPLAADKFVQAWRDAIAMAWPTRKQPYSQVPMNPPNPADKPVIITMFGDLLEPNCAEADKIIRDTIVGDPKATYEFRYYPFDQACNPSLPRQIIPGGCAAAKAAEAAGQLGGTEAYWKMHAWITGHQKEFSEDTAKAEAVTLGLKGDEFVAKMKSDDVSKIVASDIDIGTRVGIQEIPRIFVNGKAVVRWKTPNGFVLERIIDEAHKKPVVPPAIAPIQPQIPGINAPMGR